MAVCGIRSAGFFSGFCSGFLSGFFSAACDGLSWGRAF